MKKIYSIAVLALFTTSLMAQSFTMNNSLLPSSYHSGGCTGVTDMDGDGLDDIIVLDESKNLYVLYQQNDGSFDAYSCGTVSGEEQWGMCAGDVDNDGHVDVLCGGYYDNVHVINIDGPGDYTQEDYAWADIFMQGCNLVDINNDGWLDGFACHDDGHSALLRNTGDGTMENGADMIDLTFHPEVSGGNDNSGNYGSVWTDFDRDGDTDCFIAKCRQFINDPYDPRRTNVLLVNDGNNNYHDEAEERGLVNLQQSWTSDFADIDNDGDFDCLLTTHSATLQIYENDGFGYFTDITNGSGLEVSGFFLQAKFADFDNDGFIDLIHAGGAHDYYHNNGDQTFTVVPGMFLSDNTMHSFGVGDLNHDGSMDLYASYGDGYVDWDENEDDRLFINEGGENNFIVFNLEGTVSNKDAIGAVVEIHGNWGTQIREVRGGESYGITTTFSAHFGLGESPEVEFAIIHWPSGLVTVLNDPSINTWHNVVEEQCTTPTATISADGDIDLCPGESVTLTIESVNDNYIWSNGQTGESITVSGGGNFSLIIWDGDCAGTSNIIVVTSGPDPEPTLAVNGDLEFCEGGSVQLIASSGNSFMWSNGMTAQTITVEQSGNYSVEVTGNCMTLESTSIEVVVIDAPDMPVVSDIELPFFGSATFNYDGNDVRWYESETADTPIGLGDSFTTPVVYSSTSFWVEDVMVYGGVMGEGGKLTNDEEGLFQVSPSYYLLFDAHEDMVLLSVKVFAAATLIREIEVVDAAGNIIANGTFDVPAGESVINLNFLVPEGQGYGLRCSEDENDVQLWRDKNLEVDAPYDFPYNINGIATITNTNVQGDNSDNYYYFFYDWHVVSSIYECASPRQEVELTLLGVGELEGVSNINLYPNPATTSLNIHFEMTESKLVNVELMDATGRVVISQSMGTLINGSNNRTLDVSALAAGIYQIEIEIDGTTATQKVVVE